MYSQSEEEKYIVEFFGDSVGYLLDIGANDGVTFSNSRKLIELDWCGILIEPSPQAFKKLRNLYKPNSCVIIHNIAISDGNGIMTFNESGSHLPDKSDVGLLSTLSSAEMKRWPDIKYDQIEVPVKSWSPFLSDVETPFDFISIDAEGYDLIILKQIDLTKTLLLCIEWNLNEQTKKEILNYTSKYGMNKIIYQSPENLLICR